MIESDRTLVPPRLGWSQYLVLLRFHHPEARGFYEFEATREAWSVSELNPQVASFFFERMNANAGIDEIHSLARGPDVYHATADS